MQVMEAFKRLDVDEDGWVTEDDLRLLGTGMDG
jgi:Ca2+-binding EF-hand superfamily protein